jgi:ubiquinone/menaquinone biosynthesis C-methylase UbiE
LLDIGTGDAQTLQALAGSTGLLVGIDVSVEALRAARASGLEKAVRAEAASLPFGGATFAIVIAGDLFHHLDDSCLLLTLDEIHRVLRPRGALVAWWYETKGQPAPDAPNFPRSYASVTRRAGGFSKIEPLSLTMTVQAGPPTVGLVAIA